MANSSQALTHLDTHILVWLYEGQGGKLSKAARSLLRRSQLITISPLVLLELDNLIVARRVKAASPDEILATVRADFSTIKTSNLSFRDVIAKALAIGWTRDPFDRLIVANAMAEGARLITADETIRAHFKDAVWD